jgi:hypothetical protein
MIHIIILVVALIRERVEQKRLLRSLAAPSDWVAELIAKHPFDFDIE